ncbi:hypothetical protein SLS56_008579 [Neofusicoccum ribis]|uniref:Uncharacterized protein n=1 Tax=Neofusicoccum ribis TaxID=45134 RepID=A0ABR3SJQ0_9PEZI
MLPQEYHIKKEECISIPQDADQMARAADTYFSFGDKGLTVSITSGGNIGQITRFLGTGSSGLFCVDYFDVEEPYYVEDRARDLATGYGNIGVYFDYEDSIIFDELLSAKLSPVFVQDRWPRFSSETAEMFRTKNFFAHKDTVYSQFTYSSKRMAVTVPSDLFFDGDMLIRELEFLNPSHKFNEADIVDSEYEMLVGPSSNSIVLSHAGSASEGIHGTIVLALGFFVDGIPHEIESEKTEPGEKPRFRIKVQATHPEITPERPLEVTTAYKLQRIPDENSFELHLVSIPEYHSLERLLVGTEYAKLTFSLDPHFDFVFRRNLEHILSVCSIPIPLESAKNDTEARGSISKPAIALTCGDMSGHRIVTSSTLIKQSGDGDMVASAKRQLERIARWIKELKEVDKREFFAFPRPGTQKYRLEDQLWIWRALQSIEDLEVGKNPRVKETKKDERRTRISASAGLLTAGFLPAEFQRRVLKRFTTENTASRRRMIAVSRTAAETRFLFHSRDAALLYDTKPSFFAKSDTLWKATLEAQKFHDENEDSTWDNPLRYAVALVLARKGLQFNSRSAEEMVTEATEVLLGSSSPNGLFPGQINNATKEPELFRDAGWRDFYWHVGFEVIHILWMYGRREPFSKSSPISPRVTRRLSDTDALRLKLATTDNPAVTRKIQLHSNLEAQESQSTRDNPEMKKSMPFNTLIDQKSIIELPDEWLYPHAEFLDFDPEISFLPRAVDDSVIEPNTFMFRAKYAFQMRQKLDSPRIFQDDLLKGVIIDVPKSAQKKARKTGRKSFVHPEHNIKVFKTKEIYEKLKVERTAQAAKKRLIWLPNSDDDTALLCFLASHGSEKPIVVSFFERHVNRENFFFDDATAALNVWRTEFHLSFYRLIDGRNAGRHAKLNFLGGQKQIEQASISFLFTGDFFDRYWTCRVLECDPKESLNPKKYFNSRETMNSHQLLERLKSLINPVKLLPRTDLDKRPWRQRKILELLVFDQMLKVISERYQEMLEETGTYLVELLSAGKHIETAGRGVLEVSNALFSSPMNNDTYLSFSKKWPPIQYTLQVMEDDLKDTMDKITLWRTRERDREPERPRWTRNDERKYRSAITKLSISNNQKIRELEHHQTDIQSLRTSLTSRLESTRNELSFQSAENVRFFTYVTVVFLPLGFATAIFSMGGIPGNSELIGMIATAVVALCLTIIALANAKVLDDKVYKPVLHFSQGAKKMTTKPFRRPEGEVLGRDRASQKPATESDRMMHNQKENPEDLAAFDQDEPHGSRSLLQKFKALRKRKESGNEASILEAGPKDSPEQ